MPCGVTPDSPCRVTEPTLSGTDVLRQLLTLLRRTPSYGRHQSVEEIVILEMGAETRITISGRRKINAYDFYCAATCACADLRLPTARRRHPNQDTKRSPTTAPVIVATPACSWPENPKIKSPGQAGTLGWSNHMCEPSPDCRQERQPGATLYGVRVAFRFTPE